MINKKHIIKHYASEKEIDPILANNKQALEIIRKASKFHMTLFKNEALAARLLDIDNVQELPKEHMNALSKVFDFLINTEKNTQLSK